VRLCRVCWFFDLFFHRTATDYNRSRGSIYLVFEFLEHDLTGLLDSPEGGKLFSEANMKWLMKELLDALSVCHANHILHRDIKGN